MVIRRTRGNCSAIEESWNRASSTEKLSWWRTVLTQAALCLALYGAFSIGTPQESRNSGLMSGTAERREIMDLYFLSVRGGFWDANKQAQLLQQMSRTAEFYEAKFVVNIGELGDDDPLMQNASLHFPILSIPWYTTTAGFPVLEGFKESESGQLYWMQQILSVTDSKWRIVVGFHPLMVCQEKHAQRSIVFYQPLHQLFLNYGVTLQNAYLSQLGCAGQHYNIGGIAYLGIPGPISQEPIPFSETGQLSVSERTEGFLLHRVTPSEIESYFINLAGLVVSSSKIHQHGRGIM